METKRHPLYLRWIKMRSRCNNPKDTKYPRYGGRGITVCPQWGSFEVFLRDMGMPPTQDATLDRIDNDGPYSPENTKWSTVHEQNRNRRSNVWVTVGDETLVIADWAKRLGLPPCTIAARIRHGWTPEEACTRPRGEAGNWRK